MSLERRPFTAFGDLPSGAYFQARKRTWIKTLGTIKEGDLEYNAYSSTLNGNMSVNTAFFYDETLVLQDAHRRMFSQAEKSNN